MTNYYVTTGIDADKLTGDARRISESGTLVVIHYHSFDESCSGMLHETFDHGEVTVLLSWRRHDS